MTDKGKRFLKEVQKNETLKTELGLLNQEFDGKGCERDEIIAQVIAIAQKNGFELCEKDLNESHAAEITEDEAGVIVGGSGALCGCVFAGGGGGSDSSGDTIGCACVAYGQGGDCNDDNFYCMCVVGGEG